MAFRAKLTCSNCDEGIVAVYVMVHKLKRAHAPSACAYCGDTETVARAMNGAVDMATRKQPLLLEVVKGD